MIGQAGRIGAEACLLVASLRRFDGAFAGRVRVHEPQPGPLWPADPRMSAAQRRFLRDQGADIVPFRSCRFGATYPQGNKIEALADLPEDRPFLFLDSDTLVTGAVSALPLAPAVSAASLCCTPTWPRPPPYGPGRAAIWAAVHARAGHDLALGQNPAYTADDPRAHLYFSACWITHAHGGRFGAVYADIAQSLWQDPPEALAAQRLTPWLDQIALPAAMVACGARAPAATDAHDALHRGLDGGVCVHTRALPLFIARARADQVDALHTVAALPALKPVVSEHPGLCKMLYGSAGRRARKLHDPDAPPVAEALLRKKLRRRGLWVR